MLEDVVARGNRGHVGFGNPNRVFCVDGYQFSVIAGGGTYCTPRPTLCSCWTGGGPFVSLSHEEVSHDFPGPYSHVEVGFPSGRPEPWDRWAALAEDRGNPTETVYPYAPVNMVRDLVALAGRSAVTDGHGS